MSQPICLQSRIRDLASLRRSYFPAAGGMPRAPSGWIDHLSAITVYYNSLMAYCLQCCNVEAATVLDSMPRSPIRKLGGEH